jgi:4-hydroxy-2,2'-bipyrrole-5-carbaldehyde O-methyltransferase
MRARGTEIRGIVDSFRLGRVRARALAITDSRALVRSMFLASAVHINILPYLRHDRLLSEIIQRTECTRPERLQAWLWIGSELGELKVRRGRYCVRGQRARALANGDRVLVAHYRSMLEYQIGPYAELEELLQSDEGVGRADLTRYADDIAQVSLAAAPFVSSVVRQSVMELRPAKVLDVGCGTGIYSRVVLETDRLARVEGIDLAEDLISAARDELSAAGHSSRIWLHVADIRSWARESTTHFDLVMLLNNIYYFDPESRAALYRDIGQRLTNRGQVLIVCMMAPGSIAAAHLHFMLTCQATTASLPRRTEIETELLAAGFRILSNQSLVPTEPYVCLRAAKS